MAMSEAKRERSRLARREAGETLTVGDRIKFTRCGGLVETRRFLGWDGHWAVVAPRLRDHLRSLLRYREPALPLDDVSAVHILEVNGVAVQFGGPPVE
ncbi:MAG: hypothetical protein DI570_09300 [Phenylobacterium zucineum]|nr:MAG: hypothetical protein DI570_09300 [Phenylobacterium zucineum]